MAEYDDAMEAAFDLIGPMIDRLPLEHIGEPSAWPKFVRRAYLLTLPISGPIWLALFTVLLIITGLILVFTAFGIVIGRRMRRRFHRAGSWFRTMWAA